MAEGAAGTSKESKGQNKQGAEGEGAGAAAAKKSGWDALLPCELPAPTSHTKFTAAHPLKTPDGNYVFVDGVEHQKHDKEQLNVRVGDKVNIASRNIIGGRVAGVSAHVGGAGKGELSVLIVTAANVCVSAKRTELHSSDITSNGEADAKDEKTASERARARERSGQWLDKHRLAAKKRPASPPPPGNIEQTVIAEREERQRKELKKLRAERDEQAARLVQAQETVGELRAENSTLKRKLKDKNEEVKKLKKSKTASPSEAQPGSQAQPQSQPQSQPQQTQPVQAQPTACCTHTHSQMPLQHTHTPMHAPHSYTPAHQHGHAHGGSQCSGMTLPHGACAHCSGGYSYDTGCGY